mgnify:CR=1 FL=1
MNNLTKNNIALSINSGSLWVKSNIAVVLVLTTLVLTVSKSLFSIPVSLMALMGLYRFLKSPKAILNDKAVRAVCLLFLCAWLPMLASMTDAVNPGRSLETVVPYLRFLFMSIYLLQELNDIKRIKAIVFGTVCILTFWCVDVLIQLLFRANLFGYPYESGQATGMFYPRNILGHLSAVLAPLCFEWIRTRYQRHKWLICLLLPLFMAPLLSGRRAAWMMMGISAVVYLFYLLRQNINRNRLLGGIAVVITMIALSSFFAFKANPDLMHRASMTADLLSLDFERTDVALSRRLSLWEPSTRIIQDHWINGIGPRGYRDLLPEYTSVDSYWHGLGTTHPHMLILEIVAETGFIGFVGIIFWVWLLLRFIRSKLMMTDIFPWTLALFVAVMPLNMHIAFYGSYWSTVIWWLVAILFASVNIQSKEIPRRENPNH